MFNFSRVQRKLKKLTTSVGGIYKQQHLSVALVGLLVMSTFFLFWWLFQAPGDFPVNTAITIEEGMSTDEIVRHLEAERVVRYGAALQVFLTFLHRDDFIQANTYLFTERLSAREVAYAITHAEFIAPPLKVTIPEGLTGAQMVAVIRESIPAANTPPLDAKLFDEHIGYLFPETYYVHRNFTQEDLIALMRETFDMRMEELQEEITESPLTLEEIVILASIIEREAGRDDSKPIVAGILLNRLAIGMPLQVDAVFYYVLGRTSSELTRIDLQMDSPFNTYTNKGLPPTPIANPGFASLHAVLYPSSSENLYYLTAPDGIFHYSETFDRHLDNKRLYLD